MCPISWLIYKTYIEKNLDSYTWLIIYTCIPYMQYYFSGAHKAHADYYKQHQTLFAP